MQALGSTLTTMYHWVRKQLPVSLTIDAHPFKPGDAVWLKVECPALKPLLRGPFTVILSTPTEVKVAKVVLWIHHSRAKMASQGWECTSDPSTPYKLTIWRKQIVTQETLEDCSPALVSLEAN